MKTVRAVMVAASLCGVLAGQSVETEARVQALEQQVKTAHHLLMDWAGLTRYGSEDAEVRPPVPGENRVVFLGDDLTEMWSETAGFFPGKPYFNRGITRQTTGQMLVRFRQDVVALRPKVVVVQGGSNDLAGYAGPQTEVMIGQNLASMTEIAKANGIAVVLASVTPVCDCYTMQTARRPQGKIIGLNGAIREYAGKSGAVYLDYYSGLAAGRDFRRDLTGDGLHANARGYEVMAGLAERAIAVALERR